MPTITTDLGLIQAIHVGVNPPSNINMIWYNDNVGQKKHFVYNTVTAAWVELTGAGGGSGGFVYVQTFIPTASQTIFTLSAPIGVGEKTLVFLTGGIERQQGVDYTVSGTTLTWLAAPLEVVDELRIYYNGGTAVVAPPPAPAPVGHYIGELFGGGMIFHLSKDSLGVEHGLIVSLANLGVNNAWSNITGSVIGSTAQSYWNGLANSNAIIGQIGHTNSAAKLCRDYSAAGDGGLNDWYLPARYELEALFHNAYIVQKNLHPSNTLPDAAFWSSTEVNATLAWFYFGQGYLSASSKSNTVYVRAIRSF